MSSTTSEKPPASATQNPRKWRFTWEAQSHSSTLRLLLFNSTATCSSSQFTDLKVNLLAQQSLLIVSFFETEARIEVSLRVPIPRVLIDAESPVHFKAFDDHIEVKVVLLLPPDHPLVSEFDSMLDSLNNGVGLDERSPLSMDSDIKKLSAMQVVHFYCRNCTTKLTKDLRKFEEMPSVNWREVSDNWFGACCCSFGGVSEKLVTRYAKSYMCAPGVVLLSATSVLLCKDDLLECEFPDVKVRQDYDSELNSTSDSCLSISALEDEGRGQTVFFENHEKGTNGIHGIVDSLCAGENNLASNLKSERLKPGGADDCLSCTFHALHTETNKASENKMCTDSEIHVGNYDTQCCSLDRSETFSKEQTVGTNVELLEIQKVFLNGHLGSGFMERSSSLSQDIQWIEFSCPQCSCLIGAYPCFEDNVPLDGGIRLFKCNISTCLPVCGSNDKFRNYTLERMFTSQLLESAKDELSFRTIVRNLQFKSAVLQIVLLNPNSWCCTGYCLLPLESASKIVLHPTVKVLFTASSHGDEFDTGMLEEWVRKNQADEVYMFPSQIKELITNLDLASSLSPPSYKLLQGLFLSSLRR